MRTQTQAFKGFFFFSSASTVSGLAVPLNIMSLFKTVRSKHFHVSQHRIVQSSIVTFPKFFYQNIHLQLSLFLNRKGGKDIARKNDCSDTSYLRCNTGLFVAVREVRRGQ